MSTIDDHIELFVQAASSHSNALLLRHSGGLPHEHSILVVDESGRRDILRVAANHAVSLDSLNRYLASLTGETQQLLIAVKAVQASSVASSSANALERSHAAVTQRGLTLRDYARGDEDALDAVATLVGAHSRAARPEPRTAPEDLLKALILDELLNGPYASDPQPHGTSAAVLSVLLQDTGLVPALTVDHYGNLIGPECGALLQVAAENGLVDVAGKLGPNPNARA